MEGSKKCPEIVISVGEREKTPSKNRPRYLKSEGRAGT
jgi:hypothetical protein